MSRHVPHDVTTQAQCFEAARRACSTMHYESVKIQFGNSTHRIASMVTFTDDNGFAQSVSVPGTRGDLYKYLVAMETGAQFTNLYRIEVARIRNAKVKSDLAARRKRRLAAKKSEIHEQVHPSQRLF